MSNIPREVEHLDNTERFVEWLEGQRKRLGLSQEDLARRGGISHAYYSRIVNLGRRRQRYGDIGKHLSAPKDPRSMLGILRALSDAAGEDLVEVGWKQWRVDPPGEEETPTRPSPDQGANNYLLLAEILEKIGSLPEPTRRSLIDLIR